MTRDLPRPRHRAESASRRRPFAVLALLSTFALFPSGGAKGIQVVDEERSIWDGVYAAGQAARGEAVYQTRCASCHGMQARGGPDGPPLVGAAMARTWQGRSLGEYFRDVRDRMPPGQAGVVSDEAYLAAVTYILRLHGAPDGAAELTPDRVVLDGIVIGEGGERDIRVDLAEPPPIPPFPPVTDETLADPAPADWPAYGRNAQNYRFSPLNQITRENVGGLQLVWSRAMAPGVNQTAPLAYRGVIYLPNPGDVIQAIDGVTGELLWEHRRRLPPRDSLMPLGERKRGIALYGDRIYFVSWDNFVVALDARTGDPIWETDRGDGMDEITNTTGPIVAEGVVIAGSTCQYAPRGCYITGHDSETGDELWRHEPIPRPGEPGDETWAGSPFEDRWFTGVWGQITYDPELKLVHYGSSAVGPASELQRGMPGATMAGTNTRYAVRARTGEIVWSHQVLPRDNWDQECTFEMLPFHSRVNPRPAEGTLWGVGPGATGTERRILAGMPCKTGLVWAFDAADGTFLWARDTMVQDIVLHVDSLGGVTVNEEVMPLHPGVAVEHCPSHQGGRVWPPSSYNPHTNTMFFPQMNMCQESIPLDQAPTPVDVYNVAERRLLAPGAEGAGRLDAMDMETGETLWVWETYAPTYSPTMATAGGLLFHGGMDRDFRAHDQETGEVLWSARMPSQTQGHSISYAVDGRQYIAITVGGGGGAANLVATPGVDTVVGSNAIFVFALPEL